MKLQVRFGLGLIVIGVLAFLCVALGFAKKVSLGDAGEGHPIQSAEKPRERGSTAISTVPPSGVLQTDTPEKDAVPILPIMGVVCLGAGIFVTVLGTSRR